MITLTLKRIARDDYGTFGVLIRNNTPFAVTCEDLWRENAPNISCIPVGMYRCVRVQSPKFGNTFEITGVEGRTHILFHKGNTEDDTHGCVLIGERFEVLNGKTAVLDSGSGFGEFMRLMEDVDSFPLHIMEV